MKKILLFSFLLFSLCTVVNAQLSVFSDSYGAGGTFVDFLGTVNNISIDSTVARTGTSSLKAVVPSTSYVGGSIKAAAGQNLSSFNALSFWVKADASKTLNVAGISNKGTPPATYQAEYFNLPVSTTWTKYIIPIPAANKLTAEDGLFHFAEGSDEGSYTLWFDDIQYENSASVGAYSPAFTSQTISPLVGGTFAPTGQTLTVTVNGVSQNIAVSLASFDFTSSNPAVATIVNGVGTAVGGGTATITATLNGIAATGSITVNVAATSMPATAAPTPTKPAGNVISIFSNAYVDLPNTFWNPNWGQSTAVSDPQIAGNDTKKYTNLNYQGIEFTPAINASTMEFLHVDLWTPNCTALDIFLINPGPVERAFTVNPTAPGWNSFDIPLTSYSGVNLSNIFQMKLVGTPSGTSLVYMDNLYFYKNATIAVPVTAAPVPTRLPANVLSVYSDTYTNIAGTDFNPFWNQSTVVSDFPIAGNNNKKYDVLNYQGIEFAAPVDASAMEFLHLNLWTPNCTAFDVFLINPGGQPSNEKSVTLTPTLSGWNSFDIPLSSYSPIALNNIIQFKLVGTPFGGSIVYLDNIYFYKNPPTAPLTAAPVPTPVKPAANVISVYSNTYTDIAGTDFFPNWGQSTVVKDTLITGNNTKKYNNLNYQGVQFAASVNASAMEFLHLDLWTTNATTFEVFLVNTSPSTVEQKVVLSPTAYGWNSFDIPLSSYNTIALNNIGQLKLVGIPFGGRLVYLDNIYFHNTPAFAASATNLTIAAPANSTQTFNITSNTSWTATSNQSWLPVAAASGVGNATITLTAQLNPSLVATRTATVTLSGPGFATQTVTVVQETTAPVLIATPNNVSVAAPANSSASFAVTSNTSWVTGASDNWFTLSSTSGTGNATVTVTAQENPSINPRSTVIAIIATGAAPQIVNLTQAGAAPVLTVSSTNVAIAALANSTKTLSVASNTSWTAASDQSWLTLSNTNGTGNATMTLTAQENTAPTTRTATVTFSLGGIAKQVVTVVQAAAFVPALSVSTAALSIAAPANSTKTFDVTSNTSWSAVSSQSWLALNSTSGTGNQTITLTAQENPTIATRTATVTVSAVGVPDVVITVTQEAGAATLSVSSNTLTIAAPANSTKTFDIVSNTAWTAASSEAWLVPSSTSGTGNTTMTLTASENPTVSTRTATVTVSSNGLTSQVITVTQEAGAATLSVSSNTLTIAAPANSTKTFDIVSNTAWTATSSEAWLVPSSTSGTGNTTLTLTAAVNLTTATRTATITVSSTGLTSQVITVTQDATANTLTVSTAALTIAAPANSTKTFDVVSNTNWTVASSETWLVPSSTDGTGNATLTLTAAANPSPTVRTATITVSSAGLTSQVITVTQDAAGSILTVSSNVLTIAAPANSTKTFDVTSNISWTVASDQTWLAVGTASGTGNAMVTLTAQENTALTTRTATVTISGTGVGNQTITVTQEGAAVILNVSASSLSIAAPANSTKTFNITSNASWTVVSDQNWLVASKTTGSANETITLTAQENTVIATRTAVITVSAAGAPDKKVIVTQDAAAGIVTVSTTTLTIAAPANSTKTFDVASNTNWTVASDQTWLAVGSATGTGNQTVTLTAQANTTGANRTAIVTIKAAGVTDKIVTVTQSFVTGINDLDNKINFSVYPNPVNDRLFVQLAELNVNLLKMNITDLQGKTMISLNKTDLQNDVDVSALPQGVYFVQLIDAQTKAISTKKFVKL